MAPGSAPSGGALYGGLPAPGPPGIAARLLEFGEDLRAEGVAIGTSELLDAFAVLERIDWTDQGAFREALAATLAKSQEDRRVFELPLDRFFFRAAAGAAVRQGVREGEGQAGDELGEGSQVEIDLDALRE